MQRCHAENAFSGELETGDLNHYRERFDNEYTAHDDEHDFLTADDGDQTQRATKCQRPYIAHEDFCRIRVEPEKRQARAGNGAAENGELAGTGNVRHAEVGGKNFIACYVGKDGKC